ncbi:MULTISPECIES: serine O-acetyltransferase [Olivibacter]|uniref:Serine acetyltransferase n=1 Tax=Olivibacter oleidegradans TaxID=760123 RepID=A0ABV6HGX3_9SPHI|nr:MULTISPECIES: serine acetyltransferase [Olivibacter]MDM8176755.1 serine acetyltransferase [Olivibacter sp. 47]QEL00572.1 serine acetyltransferase [Olivibacter sp. LS-1]
MGWIKETGRDLRQLKKVYEINYLLAVLANRGFHALFVYRLSNWLYKIKIPLLPLILTRCIQILYGIDIDYRSSISGGIVIIHGVGLVIGEGVVIEEGVTLYHGVTLGRKRQGKVVPNDDGFPSVEANSVIGAGAKLIGPIKIGRGSLVGPNCVLTQSIDAETLVKISQQSYILKNIRSTSTS